MCVDQDLCGLYRYQEDGSTILPSSTRGPFLDFHKGIVGFIWSNVSPYLSTISFVVLWVHVLYSMYKERKTKIDSSTTHLNVEVKQTPIGWTGSPAEHINYYCWSVGRGLVEPELEDYDCGHVAFEGMQISPHRAESYICIPRIYRGIFIDKNIQLCLLEVLSWFRSGKNIVLKDFLLEWKIIKYSTLGEIQILQALLHIADAST